MALTVLSVTSAYAEEKVTAIDLNAVYADYRHTAMFVSGGAWLTQVFYHDREVSLNYWLHPSTAFAAKEMQTHAFEAAEPPSRPIGDQAFFTKGASGPRHLLLFRRWNVFVGVSRNDHVEHAPSGELDRQELEDVARLLDDAIVRHHAAVRSEHVPFGITLWHRVSLSLGLPPAFFLVLSLCLALLVAVGCYNRSYGSWVILLATFLAVPASVFLSLTATGVAHPSGHLGIAKLWLPYMLLPFIGGQVSEDNTAMILCVALPIIQVLVYGVSLAIAYHRGRLVVVSCVIAAFHLTASLLAFILFRGDYL